MKQDTVDNTKAIGPDHNNEKKHPLPSEVKYPQTIMPPSKEQIKSQKQKQSEISEKLKEIVNNNKKADKTDCSTLGKDGVGPSHLRQLLPVTLCIISFATVMSILIIYMDTTGNDPFPFHVLSRTWILFFYFINSDA